MALTHNDVWESLYKIMDDKNLKPSVLAKKANIDSTTLNKSKTVGVDGRPRWLSVENLSKILGALDMTLEDFAKVVKVVQTKRGA